MSKVYPPSFAAYCRDPNLKAAFVSDITHRHPRDCKNCGGIGTLIIFLATEGPYEFPPSGKDIVGKFVNGKWWGGKHVEEACPICHGLAIQPGWKEPPVADRTKQMDMSKVLKQTAPAEDVEDYTDI